jgi:uncharacterized protein (DUF2141 family)
VKATRDLDAIQRVNVRKLLLLIFLVAMCSCARRGLPPGGPIDLQPPRILSCRPDSGEIRVQAVSEICINFSEPMEKRTVRDAIVVRPRVNVKEVHWQKNTFCLLLTDSLVPSTTYSIIVMSGCKDAHGNSINAPHVSAFSTGDTLLAGTIRGKVETKGLPTPGTPVWAFDSLKCPAPDFTKDEPHYVSQSGSDGTFELIGLPSGVYLLFAFKDKNSNRAYDQDVDFVSPALSSVVISPEAPEFTGLEIPLVDPSEPGGIEGIVEHCYPDSVRIVVRAVSAKDSLSSFAAVARPDSSFSVVKLRPGEYLVDCFVDLNSNRVYDSATEPRCQETHMVQVMPGEVTKDVRLTIACPSPALPEEEK